MLPSLPYNKATTSQKQGNAGGGGGDEEGLGWVDGRGKSAEGMSPPRARTSSTCVAYRVQKGRGLMRACQQLTHTHLCLVSGQ